MELWLNLRVRLSRSHVLISNGRHSLPDGNRAASHQQQANIIGISTLGAETMLSLMQYYSHIYYVATCWRNVNPALYRWNNLTSTNGSSTWNIYSATYSVHTAHTVNSIQYMPRPAHRTFLISQMIGIGEAIRPSTFRTVTSAID